MQDRYILITAAKNEAIHLPETIESVLRQTCEPLAWFIVDDGSTDQTAAIIEDYAARHPFIRILSAASRQGRNFGSQYKAIMAAYAQAKPLAFDFVGVQDADIAPERNEYYRDILGEFERNPHLGIAGGFIYEHVKRAWRCRRGNSEDSVAGGIQMFRRECFEQIGGYQPLYYGGSDSLAQVVARMKGWTVKTRPDHHVFHYRPTSSAGGVWRGNFQGGFEDASFGSDPVFEIFKCCRRVSSPPWLVGSVARFCGYLWWQFTGRKPLLEPDQVAFLRQYQKDKLRRWLRLRETGAPRISSVSPQVRP